jgi:hypothetical protein
VACGGGDSSVPRLQPDRDLAWEDRCSLLTVDVSLPRLEIRDANPSAHLRPTVAILHSDLNHGCGRDRWHLPRFSLANLKLIRNSCIFKKGQTFPSSPENNLFVFSNHFFFYSSIETSFLVAFAFKAPAVVSDVPPSPSGALDIDIERTPPYGISGQTVRPTKQSTARIFTYLASITS